MTGQTIASRTTEPVEEKDMGRLTVEMRVTNNRDLVRAEEGDLSSDRVRSLSIDGLVDTGATRLVLPQKAVESLGLTPTGTMSVRYADRRSAIRSTVENVRVDLLGRGGVFTALIEPDRETALIGAIILEDLDLIVDCRNGKLVPRDPDHIISEVE